MITVYHLDTSRSERIVWLMEELGVEYRLEVIERGPDLLAPDTLKDIHPLGRAPVIRDGDTVLAESGAIVEYVVARYGSGRYAVSPAAPGFAEYLFWLHYPEGTLMAVLSRAAYLERMLPDAGSTPGMQRVRATVQENVAFVNQSLAKSDYLAGAEFTAADVMMVVVFTTLLRFFKLDLGLYPAIQAYLRRMQARPAYRRAMELAGPDRNRPG